MKRRTKILLWAFGLLVVFPLFAYGLFYYYVIAVLSGFLSVPNLFSWRTPVPNGGVITIHGEQPISFQSSFVTWEATYQPPGSAKIEQVGSWFGDADEVIAGTTGEIVVFIFGPHQLCVRTAKGNWKTFGIEFLSQWDNASIHAGDLKKLQAQLGFEDDKSFPDASVSYFSAERRELVVDVEEYRGRKKGRLFFKLSPDGERLELARIQEATSPGPFAR